MYKGLGFRIGELCLMLSDRKFAFTMSGPQMPDKQKLFNSPGKNPLLQRDALWLDALQVVRRCSIHKYSINPPFVCSTFYSCPLEKPAISVGMLAFFQSILSSWYAPGCKFPCPTLSIILPYVIFSLQKLVEISPPLCFEIMIFFFSRQLIIYID